MVSLALISFPGGGGLYVIGVEPRAAHFRMAKVENSYCSNDTDYDVPRICVRIKGSPLYPTPSDSWFDIRFLYLGP